eukprot:scaffold182_cov124-Skeletonema_menzelii.AAC.5
MAQDGKVFLLYSDSDFYFYGLTYIDYQTSALALEARVQSRQCYTSLRLEEENTFLSTYLEV